MTPATTSSGSSDGSSSSAMIYKLQWASTWGDGRKGTDVLVPLEIKIVMSTDTNPAAMQQQLRLSDVLEVRGEIVLPQTVYRQLQADQAAAAAAAACRRRVENKEPSIINNNIRHEPVFECSQCSVGDPAAKRAAG